MADADRPRALEHRVCLDGRSLALREGTGVATYAGQLVRHLPSAGWRPDLLVASGEGDSRLRRWAGAAWPGAARARPSPPPAGFGRAWAARDVFRRAQVAFDLRGRLARVTADPTPALMHWTYPLPMRMAGARNVYTVYDLIPLLRPELTSIGSARFGRILAQVARTADHLIVISETVRRDVVRELAVPPERVSNAYVPVDVSGAAPPGRVRGHFLFCGSVEPRKNVGRLLAAHRASGSATPLVLVGPDGWRADEELAAGGVELRPLEAMPPDAVGGAWRAPWLPRPQLLALMRDARAVLFPSLAEGFGLPVAEAMALGAPVLTSRGGATEEVAGCAALLVDPLDGAEMADAIRALDTDDDLRARLVAVGRRRAPAFAPEAFARRLAAVYAGVVAD